MNHTTVIGEMAGCHDLNFESAVSLIDIAREAGCDGVKMQFCSNIGKLAHRRNIPDSSNYKRLAFSGHWLPKLKSECEVRDIGFFVSVFLPEDIAIVAPHVDGLKIASLESGNKELVVRCIETGLPVIISTGCMDRQFYKQIRTYYESVANWDQLRWLHSTSSYPVPIDEINLNVIWDKFDGYSDQTGRVSTGALAVAVGAVVLEVHYRSEETKNDNPDYPHSLTPEKLKKYVQCVRAAEIICGDDVKRIQDSEKGLFKHRVK